MYLLIIVVLLLVFSILKFILKFTWPLILAALVFFIVCLFLAEMKKRKEEKEKRANIIEAEYTEREVVEENDND